MEKKEVIILSNTITISEWEITGIIRLIPALGDLFLKLISLEKLGPHSFHMIQIKVSDGIGYLEA